MGGGPVRHRRLLGAHQARHRRDVPQGEQKRHLPLYVAEFQFRYNNRLNADMFRVAIKEC
jgi:hypothetical protein